MCFPSTSVGSLHYACIALSCSTARNQHRVRSEHSGPEEEEEEDDDNDDRDEDKNKDKDGKTKEIKKTPKIEGKEERK